jgi:hypothetical protein
VLVSTSYLNLKALARKGPRMRVFRWWSKRGQWNPGSIKRIILFSSWNLLLGALALAALLYFTELRELHVVAVSYIVIGVSLITASVGFWRVTSHARTLTPRGFLIDLFLPPDRADDVLYNLLDRYPYWVEKHGLPKAHLIFLTQSLGAVLCFWLDWVLKRVRLLRFLRPS